MNNDILIFLCRELPWYLLAIWSFYSLSVVMFPKQLSKITNYYLIESIPSMFITLGLLGTFLGITYGLINFNTDPDYIKDSIKELLDGLKTAFYTSIFGIISSLIFKTVINFRLNTDFVKHPDDVKEQDLYTSMNNNLSAIREQTKSALDTLNDIKDHKLKNIANGTEGLANKLDKFFEDMANQSAGAIQEALMAVIEDFNDTFKTFIGQLVEQNFDKLTQSIDQLITWQQNYKTDITGIKEAYERLAINHKEFVNNTENWVSKLDAIAGSGSQLQTIINDFQSAFDDESRFSDVIGKINEAVDNLHNTSEIVNKHTEQLGQTTEALTVTKDEISTWLNQEEGVRSMVTALGDSLKQLREFDISQIENLDKAFITRLENTFKGLDEVMEAQLKLVLNKGK
ncbi:MotA/TolQ/ExbB proton channel family protein [Mesoflavibacter profundi]|uniref:MotA/TolQ/ExbB proton channel family protein n=1 Tax=Mesoflavibacter profundi TaxID=2708110 RepID=UPI003516FEC3